MLLDHRRFAHSRWLQHRTQAHAALLAAAHSKAKSAIRAAKRLHARGIAHRTNNAWATKRGSRDAWVRLKRMASPGTSLTQIPALRSDTGEVVTDTQSKLDTLRTHYAALATPSQSPIALDPLPAHVQAHHTTVERTVADILANPAAGDPRQDGDITLAEVTAAVDKA
jgi:hypothetical protein